MDKSHTITQNNTVFSGISDWRKNLAHIDAFTLSENGKSLLKKTTQCVERIKTAIVRHPVHGLQLDGGTSGFALLSLWCIALAELNEAGELPKDTHGFVHNQCDLRIAFNNHYIVPRVKLLAESFEALKWPVELITDAYESPIKTINLAGAQRGDSKPLILFEHHYGARSPQPSAFHAEIIRGQPSLYSMIEFKEHDIIELLKHTGPSKAIPSPIEFGELLKLRNTHTRKRRAPSPRTSLIE